MAVLDEFINYVIDQLAAWADVSARRMFGGAGLYCDGTMFGLIADDVAYLKADDSNREDFVKAGSSPFNPYPDKVKPAEAYPPSALAMEGYPFRIHLWICKRGFLRRRVKTAVMSYLATAWPSPRRVMKFLRMSLRIRMSWPNGRNVLWPSHERNKSNRPC